MESAILPAVYEEHRKEHLTIYEQARRLSQAITNNETYQAAAAYLLNIKAMRKKWADTIKPAVKAAYESHQRIKEVERMIDDPLARAEVECLKPALGRWEIIEEGRRREEQERINRELKRQEEDRALALAEELAKSGKTDQAEAVLSTPVMATEVVLPKQTDVKGISYRTNYSAVIVDLRKLIRAVADGKAPVEFLMPNGTVLNAQARSLKESLTAQWEPWGLAVKAERVVSAGGMR